MYAFLFSITIYAVCLSCLSLPLTTDRNARLQKGSQCTFPVNHAFDKTLDQRTCTEPPRHNCLLWIDADVIVALKLDVGRAIFIVGIFRSAVPLVAGVQAVSVTVANQGVADAVSGIAFEISWKKACAYRHHIRKLENVV